MKAIFFRMVKNTVASAAIEFAIIAPVLVLMTLGTIQLSLVLFAKHQLSDGLDRARRSLQIDSTLSTESLRAEIVSLYFFNEDQVEVSKETIMLTSGQQVLKIGVHATVDFKLSILGVEWSSLSVETHIPI